MRSQIKDYRTIVVKIGSNLLTLDNGELNTERIDALALEVGALYKQGRQVVIISSGAVAAGVRSIKAKGRPTTVPEFQAAAAAGQITLMNRYFAAFEKVGLGVAQILLTRDDFDDRERYLNIRNCILHLLDRNIVPIINENDSVAVDELKFGDNDMLAGYVTMGLKADLLVILSSVRGLQKGRSRKDGIIHSVKSIDAGIEDMVFDEKTAMGTGGMASKIATAKMVMAAGEAVILADGRKKGILAAIFAGQETGTLFEPTGKKISGRKRWLAFSAKAKGSVSVDIGAAAAVRDKGKSLLPAGIVAVNGPFKTGELIAICDQDNTVIAKGLSNYSSEETAQIMGKHSREIRKILGYSAYKEIIHRDNLVLADLG